MTASNLSRWEKLYLELSLQLNKYIPGLIDAYYGPADLKHKIDGQEKPSLSDLSSMCTELLDLIKANEFEESRRTYLLKQTQALNTSIKALSGEKFGFLDEVNLCFDIFPEKHDEDKFDEAISKLKKLGLLKKPSKDDIDAVKERLEFAQKWIKDFMMYLHYPI